MKVIVVSNKFNLYIEYWTKIALANPLIDFVYINDNPELKIKKIKNNNISCLNNSKNIGKVKSILTYILNNKVNDWIITFDDKISLINESLNFLLSIDLNYENIFVFDNLSVKNKIIGDSFINNKSLEYFYIKKGKVGDKIILFNSKRILDNKNFYKPFLESKSFIYETVLYYWYFNIPAKSFSPLSIAKYSSDGISKNNLENKIQNYKYYLWETNFFLLKKPCFKVLISRLFILWFLRKKGKIKISLRNRFLYIFLKSFFLFYLIKKIYKNKLKKIIS